MANRLDTSRWIRLLERSGVSVEKTRGGHYKILHPNETKLIFVGSTPSDWRALKNAKALLKKD